MGAYENPVTVIDRESGDIWANAIRDFGKMTSNLISNRRDELLAENKAFAGRLQEIQKTGLKNYDVLANSLSERGITDQQIFDQARTFQNQKTKASGDLIRNLTPEQQAVAEKDYQQADTALKGLIPYVKSRSESMADYLEQIKSNPANVGKQGFASMTENQEFQIGTWIDTGFLKGSKEIIYDKEKGWGTKYIESPEVESDYDGMNFVIWGTQAANYSVTDVPLVDKGLQAITQEVGIVDKNGRLTDTFMDINSKSTRVTYNKDGTIKATTVGVNWKEAALAINNRVEQAAKLYLQDPREANAVWRNVFNQKENLKIGPGGAIDAEQRKQFTEFLKLRAGQYIPNVDYIPGQSEIGEMWTEENPGAFRSQELTGTNKGNGSEDNRTADEKNQDRKNLNISKNIQALGEKLEKKVIPTFSDFNDPNLITLTRYIEDLKGIKKVEVTNSDTSSKNARGSQITFQVTGSEKTVTLDSGMSQSQIKRAILKANGATDEQLDAFNFTKTESSFAVGGRKYDVPKNPLLN